MRFNGKLTKRTYLYHLHWFLSWLRRNGFGVKSPEDLLSLSDEEAVGLVYKYSLWLRGEGHPASADKAKIYIIKSFYAANRDFLISPLLKSKKVLKTEKT